MFNFITNILIGLGWAFVFITIIPYLVAVVIVALSKEKSPNVVKFLKLYLLIPIFLILLLFVRAVSQPSIVGNFEKDVPTIPIIKMRRVIVGLNIPVETERKLSESELQNRKELINKAQDELLKSIPGEYELHRRFTLTPGIVLSADDEALKFLRESPLVKSITEDEATRAL